MTPHLVDHSAYDAYALLVETRHRRLFYSGDIRAHGRKRRLFEQLVANPPRGIDGRRISAIRRSAKANKRSFSFTKPSPGSWPGEMTVLSADELQEAIDRAFERIADKNVADEIKVVAGSINDMADRYWTTVYMMIIARADGKTDWREISFMKDVQAAFDLAESQMDEAMKTAALFPAEDRR